jgi:hypothetical protein
MSEIDLSPPEAAMTTSATVPVTVTPEAAARIATLGFQAQVNRILDYARQHLHDLDRIEVELHDRYDLGDEPVLAIEAYGRRPFDPADKSENEMDHWIVREFPPEVLEHLVTHCRRGEPHAG